MKYRVLKSQIEVKLKDWKEGRFYSLDEPWADGNEPKELKLCDTLEQAKEFAQRVPLAEPRYMSNVVPYYLVEEVYIEKVQWDEQFEEWTFVDSCDGYTFFSKRQVEK